MQVVYLTEEVKEVITEGVVHGPHQVLLHRDVAVLQHTTTHGDIKGHFMGTK